MNDEIYDLTYAVEETYWWYRARRTILLRQMAPIARQMSQRLGRRPRLLDFGCGTGINLQHFQSLGDAYGLDTSPRAVEFCHQRGLSKVKRIAPHIDGSIENPFAERFDIVTLLDVLEHIEPQEKTLKHIHSWIAPGGVILLTVPAYDFLWSGEDYVSHHVRRYSRRSLVRVLRGTDYTVECVTHFNTILFPIQVSVILWNRLFKPRTMYQTNVRPVSERINRVLSSIMSIESSLMRMVSLPIGGSILCIAKPNAATIHKPASTMTSPVTATAKRALITAS